MMKQPWPRFPQFSSFLPHWAHQTSQDVFIDVLINNLALWQKFCLENSMDIKKKKRSASPWFWIWNILAFLGLGDNALFHSRLCRLVSESNQRSMTHCQKQLFSASWVQFRVAPKCLDTLAHVSPFVLHQQPWYHFCRTSIMILHTLSLFISSSSAIIRTVRRWLLCTFSLTRWTFSSVLLVDGLPLLWSSSLFEPPVPL